MVSGDLGGRRLREPVQTGPGVGPNVRRFFYGRCYNNLWRPAEEVCSYARAMGPSSGFFMEAGEELPESATNSDTEANSVGPPLVSLSPSAAAAANGPGLCV